jgi:excisionase family DNA binding protein
MNTQVQPLVLSAEQLAELLDISERTLWRLLSSGKLLQPVRFGGNTRWRYAEVMKWLDEGCPSQK